MENSLMEFYPRLRAVEMHAVQHNGQSYLLLHDPLQLSDQNLLIPRPLAPLLSLCDGTHDLRSMPDILDAQMNLRLTQSLIEQVITSLDKALLLVNDRSQRAISEATAQYRLGPSRCALLAGNSYPEDPGELRAYLDGFTTSGLAAVDPTTVRGLISPHIDFERGGHTYAQVWRQAQEAVCEAELVVIFGTDHYGPETNLTLTHQNYATPFGILPTAHDVVDELARALRPEDAFAHELQHRGEHAIELAAVWLHYLRGDEPCPLVPVLCGSFSAFLQGEVSLSDDAPFETFYDTLRAVIQSRPSLIVAAADLAHVGPAFGGAPLDLLAHAELHQSDRALIDSICRGEALSFVHHIQSVEDRNNVCGTAPIYHTLRTLQPTQGTLIDYEQCPADQENLSAVSICGLILG